MTTLQPDQLVEQIDNGRIWRLVQPYGTSLNRWTLVLHTLGRNDGRRVGMTSTASVDWLNRACRDWSTPTVDPPLGDGEQLTTITDGNGLLIEACTHSTAQGAITWLRETMIDNCDGDVERIDLTGRWFGWLAGPGDAPDLICHLDESDELVWAEP